MKYDHATYLLYHLMHIHKKKPSDFINEISNKANRVQTCPRCMKKCSSPIVLALHHDRHPVSYKHFTCKYNCRKNYSSPAQYYSNDTCKTNSLPKPTKEEIDKIILKAVERDPANGLLGSAQRFNKNAAARKRSRSSSASSIEEQV